MAMLMKETRNENFLRNNLHRTKVLTKQIINSTGSVVSGSHEPASLSSSSSITAASASHLLPLNQRKKIIKNTSFDQAEFDKLISNTTNHNKINGYVSQSTNSFKTNKAEMKDDIINEYEDEEDEDEENFKKNLLSAKSTKSIKTSKLKTAKSNQKSLDNANNLNVSISNNNNNNNNTNKSLSSTNKKSKKTKKKKAPDSQSVSRHGNVEIVEIKSNIENNTDLLASKSSLFPKVSTASSARSNQQSKSNSAHQKVVKSTNNVNSASNNQKNLKPGDQIVSVTGAASGLAAVEPTVNESLRWDKKFANADEERKQIEIYKINRRKRYIEQRNRLLNLNSNLSRSTTNLYSSSCDNEYFEETQTTNENLEEQFNKYNSLDESKTINNNSNSNINNSAAITESSTNINMNSTANRLKQHKEHSNITDSAISSMSASSNSR